MIHQSDDWPRGESVVTHTGGVTLHGNLASTRKLHEIKIHAIKEICNGNSITAADFPQCSYCSQTYTKVIP